MEQWSPFFSNYESLSIYLYQQLYIKKYSTADVLSWFFVKLLRNSVLLNICERVLSNL